MLTAQTTPLSQFHSILMNCSNCCSLLSYPGTVAWISVQFPTPYKFDTRALAGAGAGAGSGSHHKKGRGQNAQLPSSSSFCGAADEDENGDEGGFMCTRRLLELCVDIGLQKGGGAGAEIPTAGEAHRLMCR